MDITVQQEHYLSIADSVGSNVISCCDLSGDNFRCLPGLGGDLREDESEPCVALLWEDNFEETFECLVPDLGDTCLNFRV